MLTLELLDLDDIKLIAKIFAEYIRNQDEVNCYTFFGNVGVGKTTVIKAICREFEVNEDVTKSTFGFINEYSTKSNDTIYEFGIKS